MAAPARSLEGGHRVQLAGRPGASDPNAKQYR
jgi:hypothetical protein